MSTNKEPPPLMCPTCGSEVRGITCVCGWYQGGVDEEQRGKWWATKPWRRKGS